MAAPELTIQIASKMAAVVIHKKERPRPPTSVTAPLVVGQNGSYWRRHLIGPVD